MNQRFEVKHRAAHQYRLSAASANLANEPLGITRKLARVVARAWVSNINEVMWTNSLFGKAWLGGANVHAFIDGGGVHANELDGQAAPRLMCGVI